MAEQQISKTDEELIDDFLTHPGYDILCDEYKRMIYQTQSTVLDAAKSWDTVMQARGFCSGLAELVNLKENRVILSQHAEQEELFPNEEDI